ncbi:MAG TPA: glycosyltransferase [Solirubrobacteraceae bacterium]|nr:glycosyltransferase [Solirubrobacteraceae bacterium]
MRILAYTSPARGHLYPITPAFVELRRRGHEVHVRTLASEVPALQALGLHADRIASSIEALPLDDWRARTPEEGLARGLHTFGERAVHEVPDLQRAIAEVDPDVLLVDITTAGAAAAAEAASRPWARWIPFFVHYTLDPDVPVEVSHIPFALSPAGMEVLNEPRRRLRLAPIGSEADVWRAPLHLYYTAEPFEVEGLVLPPSFRMVGPGIWEPPFDPPAWLEELDEPVVLVSVSSEYQLDDALVAIALEALRFEDACVVATTVAHDPGKFEVPANARVERWLPHGALLRKAACVVCHGGMGVTQKTLAAGVPVCAVPFGRDQMEVAARVEAVGAGTHLPPAHLDAPRLRAKVHEAIERKPGAQRVAAGFARAGGAAAAADAVEQLHAGR